MDLDTITIADFKAKFRRDFIFADLSGNPAGSAVVEDQDIQNAFDEAKLLLNQGLFCDDAAIRMGYLYLSAHQLTLNMRMFGQGASGGVQNPVTGRTVGSVSENYMIPDQYKDSAILSLYSTTPYGQKYLEMVLPFIVGNVHAVAGTTLP